MLEHEPSPDAALRAIRDNRKQSLKLETNVREVTYEERVLERRRMAANTGEQSLEAIQEVRDGIRAIYESQEVRDAVYERWIKSREPVGAISVKKGKYEFFLHAGIEGESKDSAPLSLTRITLDNRRMAIHDSRWMVDASSTDVVIGMGIFEAMMLYNEFDLRGSEPITVAKELIRTFNNPVIQES